MALYARQILQFATSVCMALFMAGICVSQTGTTTVDERQIAIAAEQQGNLVGAETAWKAVSIAHSASAEPYAHLGYLEAKQERYKQAVPLYRKALALDPHMAGLPLNLGLSLFKSGDMKDAIQILTPLLAKSPVSSPEAQRLNILIGMSHYGIGEFAAAVPYLKEATTHDTESLWLRLALAQSCLASKQFPCVLDVYREILALNAESAEADMLAGEALDEMRDHAGAIRQFRAAVKADPKMPNVHFALGYVLWTQNQIEEAASEFKAELANTPDHPQALSYLADVDIKLSDTVDAQPLLEKAIRLDPKIALGHLDLGIVYAELGRRTEALREMKIAEEQNPSDQKVHWRMGRFYQEEGKKAEAKAEFDKTRTLQKTFDESVFKKLKDAQKKGQPDDQAQSVPVNN
ncbi:MAG TPA: tetratricopeptide repeat protein [Terracidiphilus sp.]|nr:tetratricopeptide repeat protein [Terracidiphilus sp.]